MFQLMCGIVHKVERPVVSVKIKQRNPKNQQDRIARAKYGWFLLTRGWVEGTIEEQTDMCQIF